MGKSKLRGWGPTLVMAAWVSAGILLVILALGKVVVTYVGTEAGRAKIGAIGDQARVVCHSGGKVIFDGCSTGKVWSENSSDGYFFKELTTGRFIEVGGDCIIDYGTDCPATMVSSRGN